MSKNSTKNNDIQRSATEGTVQSVTTLIRIIETLRDLDGAGITAVANATDLSKSTVHRHLKTLREEEYIIKDGDEYRLSYRFLELGSHVQSRDVTDIIRSKVTDLARETGERVQFVVEEHGYGVYAYKQTGERGLNTGVSPGVRGPLHATSAGKAILAELPRERVEALIDARGLERATDRTIVSRAELFEQLETIRERGYAYDEGELVEGLYCVGAPIAVADEEPVGALSVSGARYRMEGERMNEQLPKLLLGAVNELELRIAHE